MGAWGTKLFENDITCDIQDAYKKFLQDKLSNQEAYDKTLEMFHECIGDEDDEPLFWYALADTQWTMGRLMPSVKAKTMEWINKGGGITLWSDGAYSTEWKMTLEKLKAKLEKPLPPERKIRKPATIKQNLWNTGDVYAYRFHTEESKKYDVFEKYMLIQKIGEGHEYWAESNSEPIMQVHVFDKLFDLMPVLEDINGVRLLPLDYPNDSDNLIMNRLAKIWSKKDYPAKHLTYIGNTFIPATKIFKRHSGEYFDWKYIEPHCGKYYKYWQNNEYKAIEEGVFRYVSNEF